MACTNANANDSNDEGTVYLPLDQVTQVERDEHWITFDGQDSGNTVVRLLSKGRRRNKENVQPELLRAAGSVEPREQRYMLQDLTNQEYDKWIDLKKSKKKS